MNVLSHDPIMSYGKTLTRPMSGLALLEQLSGIDNAKVVGTAQVAVCSSHVPSIANVECFPDCLEPATAIAALEIAAERLRTIHRLPKSHTVAVDIEDAEIIRQRAEALVDLCRAAGVAVGGANRGLHTFDHKRETCVRAIVIALATASLLPSRLNAAVS